MDLLQTYFKDYLNLYPSFASFLGDRRRDSHFENVLEKSHNIKYGRLMKKYERLLLNNSGSRSMDTKIMKWIVTDNMESSKFPLNLTPLTSFENWVIDFAFINKSIYPLETEKDIDNLLSRHHAFKEYIVSCISKFIVGIHQKQVLPKMICELMINSLESFYEKEKYIVEIPPALAKLFPVAYSKYMSFVKGPYAETIQKLIAFLKNKYIKECRKSVGMCALPRGKSMYKYIIKSLTTLDVKPEYVHRLGFQEVKRLTDEINTVKVLLGYPDTMTLYAFNQVMIENNRNYYNNQKNLMKGFKRIQKDIQEKVIPMNFYKGVEPYAIKPVPRSMEATSAGAFYYPGGGNRKGTFFINMRDMKENAKYNMMALSLHEGVPGHHYQFQYMIENKTPIQRQYSINGTAFVEGWALYAESLGNYKNNPYEYFGKLTYEMFRAVRLVVDSGIHYYNWTYNEAVDYMVKHVAISKSEIETEVQRYICLPGQALCYKIGERKITSLKQRYIAAFGNGTQNVKEFHKLILEDGIIPLSILEAKMNKIIKTKVAGK
jgi:uncharacterized protein (DUF885 family)